MPFRGLMQTKGGRLEQQEKERSKEEGSSELVLGVVAHRPGDEEQRRADVGARKQTGPASHRRDPKRTQVQQSQVREQCDFMVLSGGDEYGCQEAADQRKPGKQFGVLTE